MSPSPGWDFDRTVRLFSQAHFLCRSGSPWKRSCAARLWEEIFAAEAAALRRVAPSPLRRRVASERYDILSQVLRTSTTLGLRKRQLSCFTPHRRSSRTRSPAARALITFTVPFSNRSPRRITMKISRPSLLLVLLLVSVALIPLLASSRTLPPRGEIQQAKGANTTEPPRHPRHGGNGTAAAGNRTKGGHSNKGHHQGNITAAGGPKRGNGTAARGPRRGNGTAAGGPRRGNGTAAGGPRRGNGTAAGGPKRGNNTAAGGPSPKLANGNVKNGNVPNKNGSGGGGAKKLRRPKQIAEETCSSKTSWPEVVGMTGEKARDYILTSMPECNWDVKIIPYGRPVTRDYRTNRVRIFVDTENIVRVLPNIG
ncbi:unnamed protein product [Closterium sp. NIES-54]